MMDDFPSELVDFVQEREEPILASPGPGRWDSNMRERGWVLREGDSWSLFYTGYNAATPVEKCSLGYATSKDGISWQRYDQSIDDEHWSEDQMVLKRGDTYYMVAESEDGQSHLLSSKDKLHWSLEGRLDIRFRNGTPIAPAPFGTPTMYEENGTYYLFYERQDDGIWLATSTDIKGTFTNVSDEPVLSLGPGDSDSMQVALNQVIKYRGRYYAYYNGQGRSTAWTTNIATSTDLIHWNKWSKNPLFAPEDFINSAILVDDGDRFRLYAMHTRVKLFYSRQRPVRDTGATGPAFR